MTDTSNTSSLYVQLKEEIVDIIKTRKFKVNDAMSLIVIGVQILTKNKTITGQEKQELLISVLRDIAKGKDGKFGTADDLIPEQVWTQIETLLDSGIINSTIDVCYSLLTGQFPNVVGASFKVIRSCNKLFQGLFRRKQCV